MDWSPIFIDAAVIGVIVLAAATWGLVRFIRYQREKPVSSYWRAAEVREHGRKVASPPTGE
jgi:hypothetical protein